jgi:hypothetical protein
MRTSGGAARRGLAAAAREAAGVPRVVLCFPAGHVGKPSPARYGVNAPAGRACGAIAAEVLVQCAERCL